MRIIQCCLLWTLLLSNSVSADTRDVRVAIGLSLPPYVIAEEKRGLEYDTVKEALARIGYTLVPVFVDLNSVPRLFEKGKVDAAMTVTESFGLNAYLSDTVVTYQNYAITLSKRRLTIDSIEDLVGKSITAFQNARIYLGPAYAKAIEQATVYEEVARQLYQINRLYRERTDVVISDKNIFLYYREKSPKSVDTTQAISFHPLFAPNHYKMAFRNEKVRDDFNAGLAQLKQSHEMNEIRIRYDIKKD